MNDQIRVIIMDDHQSIVDGYLYRLSTVPQIEVVKTLSYRDDLEPTLADHPADVVVLDVEVPASRITPTLILSCIPFQGY